MFLAECKSNETAAAFVNAVMSIVPQSRTALPFISGAEGYILGFMYVPGERVNMEIPECSVKRVSGILESKGIKFEFIDGVQEFDPECATFSMD